MKAIQGEYPINDKYMEREFKRFIAILGENTWKTKISKLEAQLSSGKTTFYSEYLKSRSPILVALKEYFDLSKQGMSMRKHKSVVLFKLLSIAYTTNKLIKEVSNAGINVIRGNLRSDDTRPFIFELQIIIHFLINDYNIEFNDLDQLNKDQKNFDFIVSKDGFVGEVECKSTSLDTGRKIKRNHFYQLADRLVNQFESIQESLLIEINAEDNLNFNDVFINEIVDKSFGNYISGKYNVEISEYLFVKFVSIPDNLSHKESYQMMEKYQTGKAHFAAQGKNGHTIIVKAESEKPDFFLKAVYKSLKIAEAQFTKRYPAMISCYIDDIQEHEWEALKSGSGIQYITNKFFDNQKRSFIHTISYTTAPEAKQSGPLINMDSGALSFVNSNGKYKEIVNPFDIIRNNQ